MNCDRYQPIACALYDIYEIAIMRGQWLEMHWRQGDQQLNGKVRPLALDVRDGAEYLIFTQDVTSGERLEVRLDRIVDSRIVEP